MSLEEIANKMVAKGKGILAADESTGTMEKRLKGVNVPSSEANRLNFRETLFSSAAMKDYISGVILFDETIRQKTSKGISIPELISSSGSIPGIKVDKGAKQLAGSPDEKITEGLDGLRERFQEYYKLGARFTKWRAVYSISDTFPSSLAIKANAHALARYSALAQENGIVPIVEPEVLMDGDHSIDLSFDACARSFQALFDALENNGVNIKGTILKPSMVTPGSLSEKVAIREVAEMTVRCLKENIPSDLPGVAFLSGGQTELEATAHLNEMNKIGEFPWKLSFSYGRALQQSALKAWSGQSENIFIAQDELSHRAEMNKLAALGQWDIKLEDR